jgi:hypothetical protein
LNLRRVPSLRTRTASESKHDNRTIEKEQASSVQPLETGMDALSDRSLARAHQDDSLMAEKRQLLILVNLAKNNETLVNLAIITISDQ